MEVFESLNNLQYILQRPFRFVFKKRFQFQRELIFFLSPLVLLTKIFFYFILFPVRFLNAIYYNLILYNYATLYDCFLEIINPKIGKIRYRKGTRYVISWMKNLPVRIAKKILFITIALLESILMTIFDAFIPTLTMYHGTGGEPSILIASEGKWIAGHGNYIGSGIYFAISKKVAEYYAQGKPHSSIILARVTLGFCLPFYLLPRKILKIRNGDEITTWGISKKITTVEWWRKDGKWWEYCILQQRNVAFKTPLIRIIKIEKSKNNKIVRIWGSKTLWLSKFYSPLLNEKLKNQISQKSEVVIAKKY